MSALCIFAGPTLPLRDPARTPEVTWLPPARHGDVYNAVTLRMPRAIGIVDGYFQWVPSVWHKEILWAIDRGVHVFGAASIGALRAAELDAYGMRGVGRVFEAYRSGVLEHDVGEPFEDDDEVAVVHGPPESGYLAGSEAMVNVRVTLARAEREGVIDHAARRALVTIGKALYFPERSYEAILQRAAAAGVAARALASLKAWLPANRINQKREDAIELVQAMQAFIATDPPAARASFVFERTPSWAQAVATIESAALRDGPHGRVLAELRLDGARYAALREKARASLQTGRDSAPLAGGAIERQMLALLHASGDYDRLLARAERKQALIACQNGLPRASDFSDWKLLELRDWFFSRVQGEDMPEDLEGYIRDRGYADETSFHEAIFAEFVYRRLEPPAGQTTASAQGTN